MSSEDLIREAQDPSTSAARLAEIAQADRSTWPAIVFHPAAYDGLLQWLGERGDPTVNAALAARTSHVASLQSAAQPTPPAQPVAPAPAAQPPVEEPTVVIPAEPTPEPVSTEPVYTEPAHTEPAPQPTSVQPAAAAPEHTTAFPAQPAAYPAAYPAATGAYPTAAPTAAFGSVPPGGTDTQPAATDGASTGKSLGIVIGLVVLIIALIGGAAFGASKVFGDDDDSGITATDTKETKETKAPDTSDDDATAEPTTPTVPTIPAPAGGGASSDFCTSMKTVQDQSMDMLGDSGSSPDLDSMQDKADEMLKSYQALEQSAPAEIKADVRTMSSYLDMLKNPTADSAAGFDMKTYTEAAQRVGVYYAKSCL